MSLFRQHANDATSFKARKTFDFVIQDAQLVRHGYGRCDLLIGVTAR